MIETRTHIDTERTMKPAGWLALVSMLIATLLALGRAPLSLVATMLGIGALLAWTSRSWFNVLCYLSTLAVQVVQPLVLFRVAISDPFILPAAVKTTGRVWRGDEQRVRSSLERPFALLLAAFAIGNVVAFVEQRRFTGYAVVNKDLGILFLLVGFFTLLWHLSDRARIEQALTWFIGGVSLANLGCLVGALVALVRGPNLLYDSSINRMFGWMQNPSLTGGILMTAGLVELSLLSVASGSPGRTRVRWLNVWLLAIGIGLTLSRSTWFAVGVGAAVLLLLHEFVAERPRRRYLLAASVWLVVPAMAIGNIARLNLSAGVAARMPTAEQHAAQLQARLVSQCETSPSLEVCASVQKPAASRDGESNATTPETTSRAPVPPPAAIPGRPAVPAAAQPGPPVPEGALENARGLSDRIAIASIALREYRKSLRRIMLGIGVGTFFATSAAVFGVPLIVHNTFIWFLVEMGPLGLIAVVWIWATTCRNLWQVCRERHWSGPAGIGVAAAFAALTVFCIMNEGFYQRHLWFIFALGDRLRTIAIADATGARPVILPNPEPV